MFGALADTVVRTRCGTKRFLSRAQVEGVCDGAGYLVFSATVELSSAKLKANGQVMLRENSKRVVEQMSEDEIATELEKVEKEEIAGAADRAQRIEEEIFREFCGRADGEANALRAAAEGLAELDVFAALAEEAARTDAVRPAVDSSLCFEVDGGRHPRRAPHHLPRGDRRRRAVVRHRGRQRASAP